MSISGRVSLLIRGAHHPTAGPLLGALPAELSSSINFTDGTANGDKVDRLLGSSFTIAPAGNQVIDLASFTDVVGKAAQAMVDLVALGFYITGTAGDKVDIGPDAPNGIVGVWKDASDRSVLYVDDPPLIRHFRGAGISVGANGKIKVENPGGNSVTLQVVALGRSA